MLMALKVILGLIGALLLFLGGSWMFGLDKMMRDNGISADKNIGKSNLRGDIGGILIGGAIFIFMLLYQGVEKWALPVIIVMSCVILGRVVSLIADGKSKQGLVSIGVELLIIALIVGIAGMS